MTGPVGAPPVPSLLVVGYGPPALVALRRSIVAAKGGDPLAPVTVVVPSAVAGVTLRRALVRRHGPEEVDGASGRGIVAVDFVALPELVRRLAVGRLAASGRRPLHRLEAGIQVSGLLAESAPGPLAAVAHHPATADALLATFGDLAALADTELAMVARRGPLAKAVVGLFRAFGARGTATDAHAEAMAAAEAVDAGDQAGDDVGAVVLHLPRRLGRSELVLLAALARRSRLRAVIGRTGHVAADGPAHEVQAQLVGLGLVVDEERPAPDRLALVGLDPSTTVVVRAPDPAEEVRAGVRSVLQHLADGTAPERIAVVARCAQPYLSLAHGELAAAGVPHSAPAATTAAQSVAGRALTGLLAWPAGGHRRDALFRLLRAAPLLDPGTRRPIAPERWDRLARGAGVVAGLDQWRVRLGSARASYGERMAAGEDISALEARRADCDALAAFVARLAVDVEPPVSDSWSVLARWARRALTTYLGPELDPAQYPETERRAHQGVVDLLDRLAALDGIGPAPGAAGFVARLEHELGRPGGRVGHFGHGVFVGGLVDAVGADLDLLVVLGAAEGSFPPPPVGDPLLSAHDRSVVHGLVRARSDTIAEEDRDRWAALAGARTRVLTFPAADPRAGRARAPAPWLVERCAELLGAAVEADGVARLACDPRAAGWFLDLPSFEAWLAEGGRPATPTEFDIGELVAARAAGLDPAALSQLPVARAAHLGRGLAAVVARDAGRLGEWTGAVGAWPELADDLAHPRSATSLEDWATCPFSYLLGRVLGVRVLDDPGDTDTMSPAQRGTLVHAVLERFVGDRLGRPPGTRWDERDRSDLLCIADELAADLEAEGRTGRPLLWKAEWQSLRRHLTRILDADESEPRLTGVAPVAVEHGFGDDGEGQSVTVALGGQRQVRFRGHIDRIDRSPDGRRLVVLDYKTGRPDGYGALDPASAGYDAVARGTMLQLPIYAEAARTAYPGAVDVSAYYWFVGPRRTIELKGGPIDEAVADRFADVLATIVSGIGAGTFPARPGEDVWRPGRGPTFSNCAYCDFDRMCSADRAEQWVNIRRDRALAGYVTMAEEPIEAPSAAGGL
ncbi:MAG: PD-(D/E)XK nuclease family protein [Acidimicrobiia bacterium]